jgi:hypothetical protein
MASFKSGIASQFSEHRNQGRIPEDRLRTVVHGRPLGGRTKPWRRLEHVWCPRPKPVIPPLANDLKGAAGDCGGCGLMAGPGLTAMGIESFLVFNLLILDGLAKSEKSENRS